MRGSLLQCSYVSLGSETSQTALVAGRESTPLSKGSSLCQERTFVVLADPMCSVAPGTPTLTLVRGK